MIEKVPLTKSQRTIMADFYAVKPAKVIFRKAQRNKIWRDFKADRRIPDLDLEQKCPALFHELQKSLASGNLVQSAVFSECVYAQTLAGMFSLTSFTKVDVSSDQAANGVPLLDGYQLKPRYVYSSTDGTEAFIQAGGHRDVDGALVRKSQNQIHAIEFKEPGAKTSEPDLPKYDESGHLKKTAEFVEKYPHFESMIDEQLAKELNFFEVAGSNVNDFSTESVATAVAQNYAGTKFADVVCVEDSQGVLTMLPANQVGLWAHTRGEIRPAGRNVYAVWTPNAMRKCVLAAGGSIDGNTASIPITSVTTASARGGSGEVRRFKFHPLFFVYAPDVAVTDGSVKFNIETVRQLNPTISAHMFFRELRYFEILSHYREEL